MRKCSKARLIGQRSRHLYSAAYRKTRTAAVYHHHHHHQRSGVLTSNSSR